MTKYIIVLLGYFLLLLPTTLLPASVKNPFLFPPSISCDELREQLMVQLNAWQYRGYIGLFSVKPNTLPMVWLSNQSEWLTVHSLMTPILLLPWSISDISAKQIRWQVDLPRYCHQHMNFSMKFVGN